MRSFEDVVRAFQMLSALPRAPDPGWRRALAIYIDGLFAVDAGPLPAGGAEDGGAVPG